MVVSYLEKIREKLQEEQIQINTELSIANMKLKETLEIIKFLEAGIDRNFEAFTPRQVDGFNLRKIDELNIEKNEIEDSIDILNKKLTMVSSELEKVTDVIKIAKENDRKLKLLE